MKREIQIVSNENKVINTLEIGRVVAISTEVEMIHFDKLKDGKWRLTCSKKTIEDIKDVSKFVIVRG